MERRKCAIEDCDNLAKKRQLKCARHAYKNEEAYKAMRKRGKHPHRLHKGPVCERCDFVPEHPCQLDVDHIDGNHANNDPSNLQTLCANCHRLKTWEYQEYLQRDRGRNVVVVV